MRKYYIFCVAFVFAALLLMSSCDKYSTEKSDMGADLKVAEEQFSSDLITVLQGFTTQEIVGFYTKDYNFDGTLEAYALTSEIKVDTIREHSNNLNFWFVEGEKAELLLNGDLSVKPDFFDFPDKILVCIDEYRNGIANSNVYFVSKKHAHSYGNFGARLERSEKDPYLFYLYKKEIDATSDSAGEIFWGDSEKPYYLYFDGNFFAEYGGIAMREDQLRALSGADDILTAISDGGYEILSAYERGNGIININISRDIGNGNVSYENVTLLSEDGRVRVVPKGKNTNPMFFEDNTSLSDEIVSENFSQPEKFSYHGSYKKELLPSISVYPESTKTSAE